MTKTATINILKTCNKNYLKNIVWPKFSFLTKILFLSWISISDQTFNFWPKFLFLSKIYIFTKILIFIFSKISIFDQTFNLWPKFWFLSKISIFDQNFDFWRIFLTILTKKYVHLKKRDHYHRFQHQYQIRPNLPAWLSRWVL